MTSEPDNIVLQYLRRFDEKLDRVVDEMQDVKVRLTALEEGLAGINRRLDRLERDLDVSVEAMGLFIRHWLMITPSGPDDFQAIAQAKGRDRFALFLEALGQRLASGRRISNEVSADMRLDAPV